VGRCHVRAWWAAGLCWAAGRAHRLGRPCAARGLGFTVGLACLDRLGLMRPVVRFSFSANFIILFKMAEVCKSIINQIKIIKW